MKNMGKLRVIYIKFWGKVGKKICKVKGSKYSLIFSQLLSPRRGQIRSTGSIIYISIMVYQNNTKY